MPPCSSSQPGLPGGGSGLRDRLSPERRRLLGRFLELLYTENDRLNLTRVPRGDAERRHLDEALELLPLRGWAAGERVLDLGSGGGIPGIPLAIALPQLSVTLIERNRARAGFLLSCLGQLGLNSVTVAVAHSAELAARPEFEPAQVLVSRAAAPAGRLLALARPLLLPGGEALVHVGASFSIDPELLRIAAATSLEALRLELAGSVRVLRFRRSAGA